VNPELRGTAALGTQADGWVDAAIVGPVTLAPAAGWVRGALARHRSRQHGNTSLWSPTTCPTWWPT
jgi:hypothetical protein